MDDLIQRIDKFNALCEEREYTDTAEVRSLLNYIIQRILKHRNRPIQAGDSESVIYWVDLPDPHDLDSYWINVDTFDLWAEAHSFCREKFGCDEEGRIRIITAG